MQFPMPQTTAQPVAGWNAPVDVDLSARNRATLNIDDTERFACAVADVDNAQVVESAVVERARLR